MRPRELMTPETNTFDKRRPLDYIKSTWWDQENWNKHILQKPGQSSTSRTVDETKRIDATRNKHIWQHQDSRLHQDHLIRPRELMTPETNTFGKNITSRTPDKTKGNNDTRNKHIQQSQANELRQEHLRPKELMKSEINIFYKTRTIDYIKNRPR